MPSQQKRSFRVREPSDSGSKVKLQAQNLVEIQLYHTGPHIDLHRDQSYVFRCFRSFLPKCFWSGNMFFHPSWFSSSSRLSLRFNILPTQISPEQAGSAQKRILLLYTARKNIIAKVDDIHEISLYLALDGWLFAMGETNMIETSMKRTTSCLLLIPTGRISTPLPIYSVLISHSPHLHGEASPTVESFPVSLLR